MIRKPLVLIMLLVAFVIWQCVGPPKSPGMEMEASLDQPVLGAENGGDSRKVISQKDETEGWIRDPFSLPPGVIKKSEMEQSRQIHSEKKPMKVEGVLVSGSVKRVVIDGEIFSIGDRLENWRVIDIQRRSVILETEDGRIEIPISENPLSSRNGQ